MKKQVTISKVLQHEFSLLDEMRMTHDFLKEKNVPMVLYQWTGTNRSSWDFMIMWTLSVSSSVRRQVSKSLREEIFNLAAEQFDMNPSTTLVGDSYLTNDVMGAFNNLAWHSMWFNHRGLNQVLSQSST